MHQDGIGHLKGNRRPWKQVSRATRKITAVPRRTLPRGDSPALPNECKTLVNGWVLFGFSEMHLNSKTVA